MDTPASASDSATIYITRDVFRYAAFHNTYVSGNTGVDFYKSHFMALGYGRNVQGQCYTYPICYSCLNTEPYTDNSDIVRAARQLTYTSNPYWFIAGNELKVITVGNTSGVTNDSSKEFLKAAPQK